MTEKTAMMTMTEKFLKFFWWDPVSLGSISVSCFCKINKEYHENEKSREDIL